ncbi:MAG: WG repeat-containing protein [Bacteroidales bacterium]|nr:WG repeat-containing protein [Bacteroidales bacterium]
MNKVNILTVIAAIIICAASCGGQQPKTTTTDDSQPSEVQSQEQTVVDLATIEVIDRDDDLLKHHTNRVYAKANGKVGLVNSVSGEVAVPLIYDDLYFVADWNEEWLWAVKEGKHGLIDFAGNAIIALEYEDLLLNSGMEAEWHFRKDGKWGLILPGNKIVIPAEYDEIGIFKGDYDDNNNFTGAGLASVKRNDKWGFVNRNNTLVIPFKYDIVAQLSESSTVGEVAFVWRDGLSFWLDKNGNEYEYEHEDEYYEEDF